MLKNTLTDEQLYSLTCFSISACLNMYQNIYELIAFEIRNKRQLNELNKLEYSKTPSQMSIYAHKHVFLYLHAQTNMDTLFY